LDGSPQHAEARSDLRIRAFVDCRDVATSTETAGTGGLVVAHPGEHEHIVRQLKLILQIKAVPGSARTIVIHIRIGERRARSCIYWVEDIGAPAGPNGW
jgi:hypothetical protein